MRIKRKVLSAILCLCLCMMPLEGVWPVYGYTEDDVFTDRAAPETDSYSDYDDIRTAGDYADAELFSSEQIFEDGTEILTEESGSGDLLTVSDDPGYVFEGAVLTVSSDSGTTAWKKDKQIDKEKVSRVVLGSGVKNIGSSAFYSCANLESVDFTICTELETIGDQAFRGCGKLKSIDLSACSKLSRIGKIVFWDCSELESVNLSGCSLLQIIGDNAFYKCTKLKSIDFSGCIGLETIGGSVFWDCTSLTGIDLSACKKLSRIGASVFWGCSELESVNLSGCSLLQIIDNNAFYKCTKLKSIDFSGCIGLETIGGSVFSGCKSLTSIDLSACEKLSQIGATVFWECSKLESVNLSGCSNLDSIGNQAFRDCTSLKEIRLGNSNAPSKLGSSIFLGISNNFNVYVPANATGYKQSDWSPGKLVYGYAGLDSSRVEIVFLDSENKPVTEAEYGEVITFQANVWDESQNTPASEGSVTFETGSISLGTKEIAEGTAVSDPVTLTGDSWKPGNYTIWAKYSSGTGLYTADKRLTINKLSRTISLPEPMSVNETMVTLNKAVLSKGNGDGKVQYGYSLDNDSKSVRNWQDSSVFTNLEEEKTYYFFAKVSEGTYYKTAFSSGVRVTMLKQEGIWVNNVNLFSDEVRTITCGNGTASFNPNTNVLTLDNATVTTPYGNKIAEISSHPFIWLNTTGDYTIVLEGENYIGTWGNSSDAILTGGALTIKGSGSLEIEAGGDNYSKKFYGIHTINTDITIQDTTVTMKNEAADKQGGQNNFVGVYSEGGGNIKISKTKLNITDYGKGIGNGYEPIEIKDSQINITVRPSFQSDYGIYGSDIVLYTSDLDYTLPETEGWFMPIVGRSSVVLDGTHIKALMKNNIKHNAISSLGKLTIKNNCDINVSSGISALHSAKEGIYIEDSIVNAVSTYSVAIFSEESLTITGGEIHAKGRAAIGARKVRTASEDAQLQIKVNGLKDKNEGQTAFSDWYYDTGNAEWRNWSTFIPQDADKLEVQNGVMENASAEVWLATEYTVTFDVNGGTGTNTTVKVFSGDKVAPPVSPTRPGYYLAGWTTEDGSYFDPATESVSRDMTLYAKWEEVSNVSYYTITASAGEHGTITPSGSIWVREYTDQTFTFTPEEGYEAAEVLVDGKKVETADFYKFERVTAGHTISVSFLKKVPENYPDGTVAKPDGSFVTPDGVVILPDGTVILNDKDKTELKPDSSGNRALVNKDGTVTVQDGSVRNPDGSYARPARPEIKIVKVRGNRVDIFLNERVDGATGYDYVISPNPNCIKDKDYTQVNKNGLLTRASMFYVQQDTYYAYCHSWRRGSDGKKVFSQWSEGHKFTVSDYTPDVPVVISTANPKKGVVVVTVSVPEGAKGFDVILGRSVKKVNGEKRPVDYGTDVQKNKKRTLKTVTFRNVKPGTVYAALHSYTRSKETNTKVFSPWSARKKIKVK